MKVIPLEAFSSGIVRKALHAAYSMKALLAVTQNGAAHITVDDIASNFRLEKPPDDLVESIRRTAQTAAEAAAIVFMHSTCENAVFQLIELLVRYDAEPWTPCLARKQICFEEASSSTVEQIRKRLLMNYLTDLEKRSFPEKVERVFAALGQVNVSKVIGGFDFTQDGLVAIDDLRHRLVHDPHFAEPIPDAPAKLTYMINTLRLLVALAERKYAAASTN
jgi:hypothetical protein